MKYSVSIDVPTIDAGLAFYGQAFGFVETARPVEGYVVIKCGDAVIGLLEKQEGTRPAPGTEDVRRYGRHWTPVHIDFTVDDFDAAVESVLSAGGICEKKFSGGEHPPIAFCSDPFGNGFCVIGKRPSM